MTTRLRGISPHRNAFEIDIEAKQNRPPKANCGIISEGTGRLVLEDTLPIIRFRKVVGIPVALEGPW